MLGARQGFYTGCRPRFLLGLGKGLEPRQTHYFFTRSSVGPSPLSWPSDTPGLGLGSRVVTRLSCLGVERPPGRFLIERLDRGRGTSAQAWTLLGFTFPMHSNAVNDGIRMRISKFHRRMRQTPWLVRTGGLTKARFVLGGFRGRKYAGNAESGFITKAHTRVDQARSRPLLSTIFTGGPSSPIICTSLLPNGPTPSFLPKVGQGEEPNRARGWRTRSYRLRYLDATIASNNLTTSRKPPLRRPKRGPGLYEKWWDFKGPALERAYLSSGKMPGWARKYAYTIKPGYIKLWILYRNIFRAWWGLGYKRQNKLTRFIGRFGLVRSLGFALYYSMSIGFFWDNLGSSRMRDYGQFLDCPRGMVPGSLRVNWRKPPSQWFQVYEGDVIWVGSRYDPHQPHQASGWPWLDRKIVSARLTRYYEYDDLTRTWVLVFAPAWPVELIRILASPRGESRAPFNSVRVLNWKFAN